MVAQNGLQTLDGARVFKPCCCNSDNCKQYCDEVPQSSLNSVLFEVATVITASSIVTVDHSIIAIFCLVATVITASSIVTLPLLLTALPLEKLQQ